MSLSATPTSIAIADLNGDGAMDLVVLDLVVANSGDSDIGVLLGDGRGGFHSQVTYPVGSRPRSLAIGDLNGDGVPDVAVANEDANQPVAVLLGVGDGMFAPAAPFDAGSYPAAIAIADVNADGNLDLVVANDGSDNVSVLLGRGDGSFQMPSRSEPGKGCFSLGSAMG